MVTVVGAEPSAAQVGRRPLLADGVLNVRKERGWTSHDVVAKLRGLLRQPKLGHAGTLDPEATGVLPVLVGKATRIAEYLLAWDKEYRAVLRLGETTDTQDAAGTILEVRETAHLTEGMIRAILPRFQGTVRQLPPMYSAVKVGGKPLYKSARAGLSVEREARDVVVHELVCERIEGRDVWLRVVCSKGTYVRTLCADIGEALEVGGHLLSLERTRVGPLHVEDATGVEDIKARLSRCEPAGQIMPLDEALSHLPAITTTPQAMAKVKHGAPLGLADLTEEARLIIRAGVEGGPVRVRDQAGHLLAVGRLPATLSDPVALGKVFVNDADAESATA